MVREPHKPHGRPAQPKFGRKVLNGKAQPHLAEMRVIKAVVDMRAQGMSLRQIAAFLTQIGVPTKCRGKSWHPQMISRILSDHGSDVANPPTESTLNLVSSTK